MKRKPKFAIGEYVVVHAIAQKREEEIGKDWKRTYTSKSVSDICGMVVGAVYRQEGFASMGEWSATGDGEYNPTHFACTKTVLLIQVRLGYTNTPIEVFESDMERAIFQIGSFPWRYGKQPPFSKECRQDYSRAAKEMKRDSKGKFLKT